MKQLGIVQITTAGTKRKQELIDKIIPSNCKVADEYVLVGPPDDKDLIDAMRRNGGHYVEYTGWEKDMSRKWREGMRLLSTEWVSFFADDILPDDEWRDAMSDFLSDKPPGQYGFRLTDEAGERHGFGEDWMQFPSQQLQLPHRSLGYNTDTLERETSPTAYVANCVVHGDVLDMVQPFGLFGAAPDVMWSFAIREAGFPIDFCVKARAFHLGDRGDNR